MVVRRKPSKPAKKSAKPAKSVKRASAKRPAARKAAAVNTNAPAAIPMRTLTGQLVLGDAATAMTWYSKCFGAKELNRVPLPDGKIMHAVMRIGDTDFMLSDSFGQAPAAMSGAYLHIQDKGIRAMWDKAIANGATAFMPLANQFWGDTYGQLRDPFGQLWSFGWPAKMTQAEKDRLQVQQMANFNKGPQP